MNRVFRTGRGMLVPDGTVVYPFLNPLDSTSGLDPAVLRDFSIAVGDVPPGHRSKIHVLPLGLQVVYLLRGTLRLTMKDAAAADAYDVTLAPEEAAVVQPGTLLQLSNAGRETCRALYVVSPSYVFLRGAAGDVLYDDAITLPQTWDQLRDLRWSPPELADVGAIKRARRRALARLRRAQARGREAHDRR
jgi:hypothetical protein